VYRKRQGLERRERYRVERPARPADFRELAYRSALVPIFGEDLDAHALRTAGKLVGEGAVVEAVYVLRVPAQLSLGAGMEEEEALGRELLEAARVRGRGADLKI